MLPFLGLNPTSGSHFLSPKKDAQQNSPKNYNSPFFRAKSIKTS